MATWCERTDTKYMSMADETAAQRFWHVFFIRLRIAYLQIESIDLKDID